MNVQATATVGTASLRWSGHWIGRQPSAATGRPSDFLTGGEADREFSRSMFRRAFDLEQVPAEAPTRITADSRYVLWVNGQEVGRGPARSQPYRRRYDSYDLAPYLSFGANVIAVLVTYYGRAMSFWQPAPAGSSTDAVLVFEAQVGDLTLIPTTTGEFSAHRHGRCWSGPAAAKVCRSRSWMPARFHFDGERPTLTTRTGGRPHCTRPSTQPVSGRPDRRPTLLGDCSLAGSHSWAVTASRPLECSIPRLGTPRHGKVITLLPG
jgi:hypothetical protein